SPIPAARFACPRGRSAGRTVKNSGPEPARQMDSFELNKILGAILATCLVLLVSSFTAGAIFAPVKPEKPGYDIAVKEEDHAGGAKEAAPSEPIEKLLQTASAEKGAAAA